LLFLDFKNMARKIYIKNETEIRYMRRAGDILRLAQEAMKKVIAPGVSLIELDRIAEDTIRTHGGVPGFKGYHGFPATICTMVNSEVVHGIPDQRMLEFGDLISIDCGVLWQGMNADAAFTIVVGGDKAHPQRARFSQTVKKALMAGCEKAVAKNHIGDIGRAIESVIRAGGYSIVKDFTGHGVGYELHEDPYVFNYFHHQGPELREGMTLAIEPIVAAGSPRYKTLRDGWTVVTTDGKDACQWEHFGVVRADRFEILA
jgi:methionyl aminopeptidase